MDETEWWGKDNIHLKLSYIKESSLIILTVDESSFQTYWGNASNWFKESEYDEKFTAAFKEFDSKNGYKGLKFGMLKTAVNNVVKYKAPDLMKQYSVINAEYKNWFYIPFQDCKITFNKKNQLYSVALSKNEFSNIDYEQFLKELIDLFGEPKIYKEKSGDYELTNWQGKNISLIIMRPNDQSIYISLSSFSLNDYSPSDKLY